MNLPMLPHDKANHLVYGLVLFLVGNAVFSWEVGLALAVAFGGAKELYDKYSQKGTPDVMDFVATVAGAGLGLLANNEILAYIQALPKQ